MCFQNNFNVLWFYYLNFTTFVFSNPRSVENTAKENRSVKHRFNKNQNISPVSPEYWCIQSFSGFGLSPGFLSIPDKTSVNRFSFLQLEKDNYKKKYIWWEAETELRGRKYLGLKTFIIFYQYCGFICIQ